MRNLHQRISADVDLLTLIRLVFIFTSGNPLVQILISLLTLGSMSSFGVAMDLEYIYIDPYSAHTDGLVGKG